jgi:hypothetical protein
MNDVNKRTAGIENVLLEELEGSYSFDEFGGGVVFGADVLMRVTSAVRAVGSYDRAGESVKNLGPGDAYVHDVEVAANFISAGLQIFPSPSVPVYLMAKGGYGFGTYEQQLRATVEEGGEIFAARATAETDGSALIFEAGLGGELRIAAAGKVFVFSEATYRHRNLGHFDGAFTVTESVDAVPEFEDEWDGTLGEVKDVEDFYGHDPVPIDVDFSGVALKLGLGVRF